MSMNCTRCGAKAGCHDSRRKQDGSVTRRYKCSKCPQRFSTAEVVVTKYTKRTRPRGGGNTSLAEKRDRKMLAKRLAEFVKEKIEESA